MQALICGQIAVRELAGDRREGVMVFLVRRLVVVVIGSIYFDRDLVH